MKHRIALLASTVLTLLMTCSAWADSPKTGDTSNMPLWIALMVGAVILIVVLLIILRKNKK